MTNKEKGMTAIIALFAIVIFGLSIALCSMAEENKKYRVIIDIACDYSGDVLSCKQGVKMLKGMSIKDLENFSLPKGYNN